jgi:hypothetical protein
VLWTLFLLGYWPLAADRSNFLRILNVLQGFRLFHSSMLFV